MYTNIYTYMYIRIYIYICTCLYIYVYIYESIYIHLYAYIHLSEDRHSMGVSGDRYKVSSVNPKPTSNQQSAAVFQQKVYLEIDTMKAYPTIGLSGAIFSIQRYRVGQGRPALQVKPTHLFNTCLYGAQTDSSVSHRPALQAKPTHLSNTDLSSRYLYLTKSVV